MQKDASTVPADPYGKRQHVVEILNVVEMGTSIVLASEVHTNFHAQTALQAIASILRQQGRTRSITFERDPRWVGAASGRDFPSAIRRFLWCLGIGVIVCLAHRPDLNELVAYCTPSAWLACFCVFVSALLRRVFIWWREDCDPMIIGPIHGKQTSPPPAHDGLLAHSIGFGGFVRRQQTAFA
jgi:hypothetical protein